MLWIVIALAAVLVLALAAAPAFLLFDLFVRRTPHLHLPPNKKAARSMELWEEGVRRGDAYLATVPKEDWWITSRDGLRLHAVYVPAQQPTHRTVLCVHGYRGSGTRDFGMMAAFYRGTGCNLLLVDDRAHGRSEGAYIGYGWKDKDDVVQWLSELERRDADARVLLHGVSMGCSAVLMASGMPDFPACVRGIVADCGYAGVFEEFAYECRTAFHLPAFPTLYLADALCRRYAGFSLKEASAVRQLAHCRTPVLFIHGADDAFVPPFMQQLLYDACPAPKERWLVPGAQHAQSYLVHPEAYQKHVLDFMEKIQIY